MRSGIYANKESLVMFEVRAFNGFAIVYMLNKKKNRPDEICGFYSVKWLKDNGKDIFYLGEV